jgi:REP element-mobilizing transposase RayT
MSEYIHRRHNVSVLIYHIRCPAKYRKIIFCETLEKEIKEICLEITKRYDIQFLEIDADQDHMHFLVQSVPMYRVIKIYQRTR